MIHLTIDGAAVNVAQGATVLEAARAAGAWIPTLCDRGNGKPHLTSCMVCLVRINGAGRLMPACATPASEGMRVESQSEAVIAARRTALELLLSDHAGPCVAPCQSVCPAHMHIDLMLEQIAQEDWGAAIRTIKEEIPLPAVLGRICPELCEKGCRRKGHDAPVSICRLKREAADRDLLSGDPYCPGRPPASGKRVAVIGAGPAGLSAAYYLARAGHACTLFDRGTQAGGSLLKRTSREELPREILAAEIDQVRRMGAEILLGVQAEAADLRQRFDAVLVAAGQAGLVQTDRLTARTPVDGVFAAGAASGAAGKHAVQAVADGHFAARAITAFLAGLPPLRRTPDWNCAAPAPGPEELARKASEVCCDPREDVAQGDAAGARRQADRCLRCGCTKQENCTLREVAAALDANPNAYRGERRTRARVFLATLRTGRPVTLDQSKCIACGKCIAISQEAGEPFGLSWMHRGFSVEVAPALGVDLAAALQRSAEACAAACPTAALMLA